MKRIKTILLVGGGTGGHIVPILNLRRELYKIGTKLKIITVGGNTAVDQKLYQNTSDHIILNTGKLHRNITVENFIQLFLLLWGIVSALRILRITKPDLIFSKAGYVSLPIIFWAKILKIPYFIHESDIEMGVANKYAARGARKVFVGFPVTNYSNLYKSKLAYVGQMLPSDYGDKTDSVFDFGFENNKPIIFVTGGSQGASNINNAIFDILPKALQQYNIVHHTGLLDYKKAVVIRSKLDLNIRGNYFISALLTKKPNELDLMKSAIIQSSVVICRASATTLAEVSIMKKPIIAIPYKYAAGNHQTKNAIYYKRHRALFVIADDKLNGQILWQQIEKLFSEMKLSREMGKRACDLQVNGGLSIITAEINRFLNAGEYEEI